MRIALLGGTALVALMTSLPARALPPTTNATWSTAPGSVHFGTASNWNPATVPNGIATFGVSTTTSINLGTFFVGTFQFNAGAPQYNFTNPLGGIFSFNGLGIVNNSSNSPIIINDYRLSFANSSSAGNAVITNNRTLAFTDSSTADNATITNNLVLDFFFSSTAGNATIINNDRLGFLSTSTAGNAAITNGAIGIFEMSQLSNSGMTAGSIAGGGFFRLGSKQLTVGSNNLSTTVIGAITDGGFGGGIGGSLVKVGSGTLTLAGVNTYTGATSVNAGALTVSGSIGSAGTPGGAIDVASGATLNVASTGSIDIHGNDLTNFGAVNVAKGGVVTDALLNHGFVSNRGVYNADVQNFAAGVIYNYGTWNGLINNQGVFVTSGVNNGDFNNAGTLGVNGVGALNGNYIASAANTAILAIDTGPGSVSRMIVNGNATGGATAVSIRDALPNLGSWYPVGATVLSISGSNSGGGFYLDPSSPGFFGGVIEKGLYTYVFGQGPGVGCQGAVCYSIYSAPSAAAMRLPIAVTAAQDIFQNTALMWEDRQTELRDQVMRGSVTPAYISGSDLPSRKGVAPAPGATTSKSGISLWVKSIGAWTSRSDYQVAFAGPYALGRDLGYNQSTWGMLGGANGAVGNILGGEVNLGVLGGYLQSSVNFNQGSNNSRYQGGTVGVSASYINRGFFVDGLFKADLLNLQMGLPWSNGGYTSGSTSVNTVGGVWNAGYHYTWGQYFIEPTATLTYSATSIGALNQLAPLGAYLRFGSGSDFRGGFGGRVGTEMANLVNGHVFQASVTGRVWDQFDSNGGRTVDIVSGGIGQTIGDYTLGAVYGEVKGNIALMPIAAGWSTYVSGGAKFNNQFTTWTARGGVGYSW